LIYIKLVDGRPSGLRIELQKIRRGPARASASARVGRLAAPNGFRVGGIVLTAIVGVILGVRLLLVAVSQLPL